VTDLTDEGGDSPCWAHLFEDGEALTADTLASLVRSLADAVIIADPTGTIVFWNAAAQRLFGWTSAEAVGSQLTLIVPERLRDRHNAGFDHAMAAGTTKYGEELLEVPALHRDGRPLSIAFTVTLLHGESGVAGVAAVVRDETAHWQERKQLRAELDELRQAAKS
jgi:PAS domain S-box-containing protein